MKYPEGFHGLVICEDQLIDITSGEVRSGVTGRVAHLFIWGPIGGWWGANGKQVFRELAGKDQIDQIRVYISSGGGGVVDAVEIYHLLKSHPAQVITHVFGLAASAATIISSAGDRITMADPSIYMIHQGRAVLWNVHYTEDQLDMELRMTRSFNGQIRRVYSALTGKGEEEINAMMKREEWMQPQEALENGFISAVENIPIPFHLAGVTEEEFYDVFEDHTEARARALLQERGFVASMGSSVQSSFNKNPMSFKTKIFAVLAGLGINLVKDNSPLDEKKFEALLGDEQVTNLIKALQPEADQQANEQARQMIVDVAANAVSDLEAEFSKKFTDQQKVITDLQTTVSDLSAKLVGRQAAPSGGQPSGDNPGSPTPPAVTPPVEGEQTAFKGSSLQNRLFKDGVISQHDLADLQARVAAKRKELGKPA